MVSNIVQQAESIVNSNCHDAIMEMDTSDGGNADAFVELYGDEYLYVTELGWLHWNGKYWKQDEHAVWNAMRDSFDTRHDRFNRCKEDAKAAATKRSTHRIRDALEQAQHILAASIDDFDKDPDEINVDNGVLNLKTWEVVPHEPLQFFTYAVPVPFDEHADTSVIVDFMKTTLTVENEPINQELVDFVQTALGYSITGHTREEKLLYLYGKLGRNGKGSVTEAMLELLPYPIAQEVDFNTFVARRDSDSQGFDLADMKASRVIFASESNKYQMLNPATIKKLTGGNWVRARHLYKEFFTYRPQYTPILSSNHKVNGDPDDSVMWNRVAIVEFPNSYMGKEDKRLKERLKKPEAQKGLLLWLALGAKRWYADGLEIPDQVNIATRKHQEEQDTLSNWIEESIRKNSDSFVPSGELYQNYEVWCKANGVTPKGATQFRESMQAHGYVPDKGTRRWNGKVMRGYSGIELVSFYTKDISSPYYVAGPGPNASETPEPAEKPTFARAEVDAEDFDPDSEDFDISDD